MPKVSIIVPVYKVEQYIRECLDSIKAQTFTDWECLLIDDGSPDNSGNICDEYAQADARFRVFHVENGGVSRARNIGLDNMTGEWMMFVDSDDAIYESTLEMCLELVYKNELDMLQFSFARIKGDLGKDDSVYTDILGLENYIKAHKCLVCVGGSLLRSSIIVSNRLRFDPILKLAEDQLFMFMYMNYISRVQRIGLQLYWYRINENSATHHSNVSDITNSMNALSLFKNNNSVWQPIIDKTNLTFAVDMIAGGIDYKSLHDVVKRAHIGELSNLMGSEKLFYTLSRFSVSIAFVATKAKFSIF